MPKIQCLIERQGPTTVMYNGMRFDFVPNEHGHYVCEVANNGAVKYFLETFAGKLYQEYVEPVAEVVAAGDIAVASVVVVGDEAKPDPVAEVVAEETGAVHDAEPVSDKEAMISKYEAMGTKNDIEAACLEDFGVNLNKSFGLPNLKLQVADMIAKKFEA
ncbi:MAG: hypothetical protein OEV91_06015 [Desulfobulbaceae bacterium]|nr:hypothetical protein [Desulfobulbaceae bacterium]